MVCAMRSIRARRCDVSPPPHRIASLTAGPVSGSAFSWIWKDFSRFVEVAPVDRGWLVLWGRYLDRGKTRQLAGQRTYTDLAGARRRVADSVHELTGDEALVAEAIVQFDRARFPDHTPAPPTDPL
jgi:hypothetical protein